MQPASTKFQVTICSYRRRLINVTLPKDDFSEIGRITSSFFIRLYYITKNDIKRIEDTYTSGHKGILLQWLWSSQLTVSVRSGEKGNDVHVATEVCNGLQSSADLKELVLFKSNQQMLCLIIEQFITWRLWHLDVKPSKSNRATDTWTFVWTVLYCTS